MECSKYKKATLENYKSIAKTYGMTVPALKKVFQKAMWLDGNVPTDDAIANGIAVVETVSSDTYGTNERILWSVPVIAETLKQNEFKPLEGKDKYLVIRNFHQLVERIGMLGEELIKLLNIEDGKTPKWIKKKFGKEAHQLVEAAFGELLEAVYENAAYMMIPDKKTFDRTLDNQFAPVFKLAAEIPEDRREDVDFYKRLFECVKNWATQKKLTQFNR